MAGAEKSRKMFEKLFDKALAEMRQRHEKLNSQVAQWVSRAENELGIDASLKGLSGRMEQLHKTQLETMGQWQKEFESRFQQMLDFQKQMLDSLLPGTMKSGTRAGSTAASAPLVKQDVTTKTPGTSAKPAAKAGKASTAKAAKTPRVSTADSTNAPAAKVAKVARAPKTAKVTASKSSEPKTARKTGGSKKAGSRRATPATAVTVESVGQSVGGEADAASANDSSGQV